MAVNPVTKLVQPHGLVLYADKDHIDRAMDDYATGDDIYSTDFEPPFGLAHVATSSFLAATEASAVTAGPPAAAAEPSSARRRAGTPAQS
jgi:hypothetical protein